MGLGRTVMKKAVELYNQLPNVKEANAARATFQASQASPRPKTSDIITHIGNIGAGRVGVPDNAVNIEELQKSRKLG